MRPGLKKRLIGYPLFFGGFYFGLCLVLANVYLKPARHVPATPEEMSDVTIPTDAGPDPAWATPALADGHPKGNVVFVMAHGYGGTRAAWRGVLEGVAKAGYEAVDPALPGQDASPDKSVGFGFKESRVVIDAVRWARGQYPSNRQPKVVLLGVSMGGSACWLASEQIPNQVDAVITEGAFARFDVAMGQFFDDILPGGHVVFRPVVYFARRLSGIDPSSIRPIEAAAKWRKPALIIQGGSDKLILRTNADQLSRAAGCPLWVVPGAEHAQCYRMDPKAYLARVLAVGRKIALEE